MNFILLYILYLDVYSDVDYLPQCELKQGDVVDYSTIYCRLFYSLQYMWELISAEIFQVFSYDILKHVLGFLAVGQLSIGSRLSSPGSLGLTSLLHL